MKYEKGKFYEFDLTPYTRIHIISQALESGEHPQYATTHSFTKIHEAGDKGFMPHSETPKNTFNNLQEVSARIKEIELYEKHVGEIWELKPSIHRKGHFIVEVKEVRFITKADDGFDCDVKILHILSQDDNKLDKEGAIKSYSVAVDNDDTLLTQSQYEQRLKELEEVKFKKGDYVTLIDNDHLVGTIQDVNGSVLDIDNDRYLVRWINEISEGYHASNQLKVLTENEALKILTGKDYELVPEGHDILLVSDWEAQDQHNEELIKRQDEFVKEINELKELLKLKEVELKEAQELISEGAIKFVDLGKSLGAENHVLQTEKARLEELIIEREKILSVRFDAVTENHKHVTRQLGEEVNRRSKECYDRRHANDLLREENEKLTQNVKELQASLEEANNNIADYHKAISDDTTKAVRKQMEDHENHLAFGGDATSKQFKGLDFISELVRTFTKEVNELSSPKPESFKDGAVHYCKEYPIKVKPEEMVLSKDKQSDYDLFSAATKDLDLSNFKPSQIMMHEDDYLSIEFDNYFTSSPHDQFIGMTKITVTKEHILSFVKHILSKQDNEAGQTKMFTKEDVLGYAWYLAWHPVIRSNPNKVSESNHENILNEWLESRTKDIAESGGKS